MTDQPTFSNSNHPAVLMGLEMLLRQSAMFYICDADLYATDTINSYCTYAYVSSSYMYVHMYIITLAYTDTIVYNSYMLAACIEF